jgi:hypothetical protein
MRYGVMAFLMAAALVFLPSCSDGGGGDGDADGTETGDPQAEDAAADDPVPDPDAAEDAPADPLPELDMVGDECVPPGDDVNLWIEAEPGLQVPPELAHTHYIGASGYGNVLYRTLTGDIIYLDGIMEDDPTGDCFYAQTFYANTIYAWNMAGDTLSLLKAMNYGGGSYGYGCLLPAFADEPTPSPRHTYEGFVYVEPEDALYLQLGAYGRMRENATAEALAALDMDDLSTWKYTFADNRWQRIDGNIRQFWPGIYGSDGVSDYESHMVYWPSGNRLLFVNDNGNNHAEFLLDTQTWQAVDTVSDAPFSLYEARSAWDPVRERWVFRKDTDVAFYDPAARDYAVLPSCDVTGTPGITYIPRWDVYFIVGLTAAQTRVFHPDSETWETIDGGDIDFGDTRFLYPMYDPVTDRVGLVRVENRHFWFRYVPEEGLCP